MNVKGETWLKRSKRGCMYLTTTTSTTTLLVPLDCHCLLVVLWIVQRFWKLELRHALLQIGPKRCNGKPTIIQLEWITYYGCYTWTKIGMMQEIYHREITSRHGFHGIFTSLQMLLYRNRKKQTIGGIFPFPARIFRPEIPEDAIDSIDICPLRFVGTNHGEEEQNVEKDLVIVAWLRLLVVSKKYRRRSWILYWQSSTQTFSECQACHGQHWSYSLYCRSSS